MKRLIIILFFVMFSCGSKKKAYEQITSKDSVAITLESKEITKGFSEKVFIPIPYLITGNSNCDSLCNEALKKQLAQTSLTKTSGNSAYTFGYKPQLHGFNLELNTPDTFNQSRDFTSSVNATDTQKETITLEVIPKWVLWILLWGILNAVYWANKLYKNTFKRMLS